MQFLSDLQSSPLLLPSFLAGLLAAVVCGLLGPLVVTRRIVFLCDAISHTAILGVGGAIALRHFFPALPGFVSPASCALATALLCAVTLAWLHGRAPGRLDALIGGILAAGLSGGILLAGLVPNSNAGVMGSLFGNPAVAGWAQVRWLCALIGLILAVLAAFYKQLLALCVDEQQLKLQGLRTFWIHAVLLALVACSVVALMQIVGAVLALALIALPAATAGLFKTRLLGMMGLATLICLGEVSLPRILAYDTPVAPGPAIVLSAGLVFLLALGWKKISPIRTAK